MKKLFSSYTSRIILINLILFVFTLFFIGIIGEESLNLILLQPSLVLAGKNIWTLLTSMFLHIELWHLLANMVSLFFLGMFVEKLVGKKRFVLFYFIAGLFAGLFYAVLSGLFGGSLIGARIFGDPNVMALGASGAIFGLLGLLAVLTPRNRVSLITGPIIAIIVQLVANSVLTTSAFIGIIDLLLTVYIFFSIFAIFSFNRSLIKYTLPLEMDFWLLPVIAIVPLIIIGLVFPLPIGNTAHLGGLIVGLVYGFYLKKKYPRKTRMISRYFKT